MADGMSRRVFLTVVGGVAAGAEACVGSIASISPTARGPIPEDKGFTRGELDALRERGERRVYRGARRFAIGMPIGGICAGQLYLLGDGTLGGWKVDGRQYFSGYGSASYEVRPPSRELAQGFVLAIDGDGGRSAALRDADGSPYEIEFVGEYPIGEVRYRAREGAWPDVTLRAYSPFVALSARDSANPCTVLRYRIENTTGSRVRGRLVGHLENGVCLADGERPLLRLENRVVREAGLTGVAMSAGTEAQEETGRADRVLFDFEGGTYEGWTVEGEAFGDEPASGTHPNQQRVSGFEGGRLVNSFTTGDGPVGTMTSGPIRIDRRYLVFLVGGGSQAGRTCVNLRVDGEVVRTATGKNNERLEPVAWDVRELEGREAVIEIVDAASGGWGHVNADRFVLTDRLSDELAGASPASESYGTMGLFLLGEGEATAAPAVVEGEPRLDRVERDGARASMGPRVPGVVAGRFDLAPGESTELVFVVSWHFPNLHTGHGRMYSNWYDDATGVARWAVANDERLRDETELLRRTLYEDTTLPWWLMLRLMMPTANLATGTAQWWANGRFWGWEGVGCCHGTCTHVWNYAHGHARLFPELARSARVMQDLGTAFDPATGRVAFRGDADAGFGYAADGQAGTVLKCYREHLCSPDDAFLRGSWERIRLALEFLIAKDAEVGDAAPDGMIEGSQHNTYDINFEGPNTFVGSLYVAALLACAEMAERVGDRADADRYRALAASGRAFAGERLFNGEYFVQKLPSGAGTRFQYVDGCLSDQLFGQSWAALLDLPEVYGRDEMTSALRSVYRYNWTPSVAAYSATFPPERVFARGRDAGMFICTWPRRGRPEEPVRYRDEVWTGIEYQAATGMVDAGLVDEALTVVRAIDDRYEGAIHNPWNEVECGDHYARAMASWGTYLALCGFVYDGPRGVLGMAPRLRPERFSAFFSGAEGWGVLRQTRDAGQTNEVDVRWGSVAVSRFGAVLPDEIGAEARVTATVQVGGRERVLGAELARGRWWVDLGGPVSIRAGESLRVSWIS